MVRCQSCTQSLISLCPEGEQILFNKNGSNYTISSAIGVTTYDMSGDEIARYDFKGRVQSFAIFSVAEKEYISIGDGEGYLCTHELGEASQLSKHKLHDIRYIPQLLFAESILIQCSG
jgi:hypothetical protein